MKPQDITTAVKKRWWIIVAIVLASALTASIAAHLTTPVYKAEVKLSAIAPVNVTTGAPDATIQLAYQVHMTSIANAGESLALAKGVAERLGNMGTIISPEDLVNRASSQAVANSSEFKVTLTDTSPSRVALIANLWAEECIAQMSGSELLLGGTLTQVTEAIQPSSPTQPKSGVYLTLGVFLGLILGFSIVLGWEYFDPHFRSEEETAEMLGVPVLGVIPKKTALDASNRELYSGLRASIMFSRTGEETSSVAVSAAIPGGEEQHIAINLAKSIAGAGARTLLVDCDLRSRTASELMGAGGLSGLSEIIEKGEPPSDKIATTSVDSLFLLPAGKPVRTPSDILSLQRFTEVMRVLERNFDWVVLSVPPLTSAVDAALVISKAQSSLVVIDTEACTRNAVLDALQILRRLELEPSGVVLTNVKQKRPVATFDGTEQQV